MSGSTRGRADYLGKAAGHWLRAIRGKDPMARRLAGGLAAQE